MRQLMNGVVVTFGVALAALNLPRGWGRDDGYAAHAAGEQTGLRRPTATAASASGSEGAPTSPQPLVAKRQEPPGTDADDTADLQELFNAAAATRAQTVMITRTYLISAPLIVPQAFHGRVYGTGVIKARPRTAIARLIDISGCSDITWEVAIDMGQTRATEIADPRCQIGLYVADSRDIDLLGVRVGSVRIGRPVFITGTSSPAPKPADGSRRIRVVGMRSIAYPFATVDEGAYPVVRSDFFTGDGGGRYYKASNALRRSDYQPDPGVTFPATTRDVWFTDCYFENMDRFAVLNAESVHIANVLLINAYTRGFNVSPTSRFITIRGGRVTGGSASAIAFAYGTKHCTVDGVTVDSGLGSVGEQSSLKTYFGCEDISFANITGVAAPQRAIYVHSSRRIHFSNISMRRSVTGNTVYAVAVSSGEDGNRAVWETRDISVRDSSFESSYSMIIAQYGSRGTARLGVGAVRVDGCSFDKRAQFFAGESPQRGEVELLNSRATRSANPQELSSRSFKTFAGNNLHAHVMDTVTVSGASATVTFPSVWYFVPERDGLQADAAPSPAVQVWRNGSSLFYGIDWVADAAASGTMWNEIRLIGAVRALPGDRFTIHRLE